MASEKGRYVRRYDRNGNAYFIDRETGKRVTRETWQRERDRIARRQEREQRKQERQRPSPPVALPPLPELPEPPAPPPFPPGVTEHGEPIDEFYEFDDDAFAVEGEDDT